MKSRNLFFLAAMVLIAITACNRTGSSLKTGNDPLIEKKIAELVSKMTLEEKVGQMTQVTIDALTYGENQFSSYEPVVLDTAILFKAFSKYQIGSVLNTANNRARPPREWNRLIGTLQEYAAKYSKLQIPIIYGLDMIHGASYVDGATLFPQQIGMASTWNPNLIREAGIITAYETKATGATWIFSPVMDLGIDPRWPRFWETFGEDPFLASSIGHALIQGEQGDDNSLNAANHVGVCLKHYLGYSQPLSGKDRTPAWIPMQQLREYHLPPFREGVESGAMTVMVNSGEINGIPVHSSKELLTDLLKNELNFEGFIVSDWQDIENLHTRHKIAETHREAVKIAINAGIDMSMVPYNFDFADHLIALVNDGEVPMTRINDAVTRILRVKFKMGLFEKSITKAEDYPDFGSAKHAEFALKTAEESIVLLKNADGILPLSKTARVLVCGPAANLMRPLNGGWSYSWQGNLVDEFAGGFNTIFEALQKKSGNPDHVFLYEGVSYDNSGDYRQEKVASFDQLRSMASRSDYVLVCVGENSYTETPGNLDDLNLSENQQELVKEVSKTGKPVICVLVQGRPRLINKIEPLCKGVIYTGLPGNFGGDALAGIIYGEVNPSGKLPFTYPRYANNLVPYYHKFGEQLEDAGSPSGTAFNPQFSFGFGLSYAEFKYQELRIAQNELNPDDTLICEVILSNVSQIAGKEVVQVYISDRFASVTPSVKRLKAFEKVNLQPGESKNLTFHIPVKELGFINPKNQYIIEKGDFEVLVNGLKQQFKVTSTKEFK